MRATRITLVGMLSTLFVGVFLEAAQSQPQGRPILKVYDIGDLVMKVQDYPYPGRDSSPRTVSGGGFMGGGGMGGGGFGGGQFQLGGGGLGGGLEANADSSTERREEVIELIQQLVEPVTWVDRGDEGIGEIKAFGNSLLIIQTPEVHDQIAILLKQIREGSGERKTVSIDAYWLPLNSEMLGQLVKDGKVNRQVLAEFIKQPGSIRLKTSCFSGQLVYVESGKKSNIVSGYIPVVGSLDDGSDAVRYASVTGGAKVRFVQDPTIVRQDHGKNVGYQPVVARPNLGAVLEIRPTLVQGSNSAIVDLLATVTSSEESAGDAAQRISAGPPEVDRISILSQELATTVRVPVGEPVLVGGMTVAPARAPGDAEQVQLYLVLEVR